MIEEIRIQNLATIEELHLKLGEGLNILTGETGAGKSLFLEAFGWLIGLRADRTMIREGKDFASVEMVLSNPSSEVQKILADQGWEDCDPLIVFRQVSRSGSSRIILNNRHVTLGFLRELLESLLLLHSQNQNIELLKRNHHLTYLDSISDDILHSAISNYQSAWLAWQTALADYKDFCSNLISAAEENFLRFQYDELEEANLDATELSGLEDELQVLENGKEIALKGQRIYDQIHNSRQMLDLCESLRHDLQDLSQYYEALSPFADEVRTFTETLMEISSFLQGEILELDLNPQRMEAVESRLQVYYDLTRKYDMTLPNLLAYQAKIQEQLDNYALSKEKKAGLQAICEKKEALTRQAANTLTQERKRVGQWLAREITGRIRHLEMKEAIFDVRMETLSELSATGTDQVEFYIQTNLGASMMPLRKIASGGETSRILLALLIAQGKSGGMRTMIFDEIDAGLSGKAALRVAEILDQLAEDCQVVCVTHQPQVASFADQYYQLHKINREQATFTQIAEKTGEAFIHAVAQLVSGDQVNASGQEYAREMVHYAQKRKEQNHESGKRTNHQFKTNL